MLEQLRQLAQVGPWLLWMLLLARASGLLALAPALGWQAVPVAARAGLAIALAVVMFWLHSGPWPEVASPVHLTLLVAREFLVGLCLGFAARLVLFVAEMAGEVIGFVNAMSLAEVVSPGLRTRVPVLSQLLGMVALGVFLALDGPAQVVLAMAQSLQTVPPGGGSWLPAGQLTAALLQTSFQFALRIAAPTVTAVLASNLLLGLLTRTLPQLNIFVLGLGINALVTLALLALSLGAVAYLGPELLESHLDAVLQAISP